MPTEQKDNVYLEAGETLRIEVEVKDSVGQAMILAGAVAKFGISINGALTTRVCDIIDNLVIAILTDEETSTLDGNYRYAIVLELSTGEKKRLAYGIAVITTGMIKDMYGTNPLPEVIPAPSSGSGIIPITGWVANSGTYAYKLDLDILGLMSTDLVYIAISQADLPIAYAATLAPSCDTYDGGITFYAETIPTDPMEFSFVVTGEA